MKSTAILLAGLLVAGASSVASATPIQKGSSIFAVQLYEGDGDFVSPESGGYVTAYDHSEIGVQAQFWHFVSDAWAVNLSGGVGFFKETDESEVPTDPDFEYKQHSWQARVGIDRVAHITDSFHLFVGPGIQYWSGDAEAEGLNPFETGKTHRIAFAGRIGAHVKLGESFGLVGHIGRYIGHAKGEDEDESGAEASWWPSGGQSAVGFAFNF